jgi:D-3-phosphoglycerate dehydrogenase
VNHRKPSQSLFQRGRSGKSENWFPAAVEIVAMPSILIGPYLLRNQPGTFRKILSGAGFELIDPEGDLALTREQLQAYLPRADAMLAGGERLTADLFELAPWLRVVARTGVGYDLIDLKAATSRNVVVTITPGTNHDSVAEQAFALILALSRNIVSNDRAIHARGWDRRLVAPVRGKTLGLIGLGRIGQAVALRARAFGMKVLACDPLLDEQFDQQFQIRRVTLDQLLAESDIISLHAPLTDATRGLVDRGFLARMRPGSLLINTARGGLVVEADLRDSLVSGHLAGAGLDVLNHEPPEPGNPLLGLPSVVLSPHIAGTDHQSMSDMADLAARTIVDLYHNRWPAGCVVNGDLQQGWRW